MIMSARKHVLRSITCFAIVLVTTFLPQFANAQPGDPLGDPDLPIDGGVSLLIAAGVGYGVKKYRDERRKTLDKKEG